MRKMVLQIAVQDKTYAEILALDSPEQPFSSDVGPFRWWTHLMSQRFGKDGEKQAFLILDSVDQVDRLQLRYVKTVLEEISTSGHLNSLQDPKATCNLWPWHK